MNRRLFFKSAFWSVASAVILSKADLIKDALAKKCGLGPKGKKLIDPASKSAKRLKFVMVASESKHKKYKAGQTCYNCKFYKRKKVANDWAPCTMLANKYVPNCGWCKSFKLDKKVKA